MDKSVDFIIDIPSLNKLSGGIARMLEFNSILNKAGHNSKLHLSCDNDLPDHDYVITYSDNPRIEELCLQAKKVIVYQLSYGMCLERENKVVCHPDTIVCCSTTHIQSKILNNFSDKAIYYIGHSQEKTIDDFYPQDTIHNSRLFDVTIMIHKSPDKHFLEAFEYCKSQGMKICLFGARDAGFNLSGASRIVFNADIRKVRWVLSNSKKYLSLSSTEGLNRPGIEAMLCGCKPYIVDGCEIYKDSENCKFIEKPEKILADFKLCDYIDIKQQLRKYTWNNVLINLSDVIGEVLWH